MNKTAGLLSLSLVLFAPLQATAAETSEKEVREQNRVPEPQEHSASPMMLPAAVGATNAGTMDSNGTFHLPSIGIPLSPLLSAQGKQALLDDYRNTMLLLQGPQDGTIATSRRRTDDLIRPAVEKLRNVLPVKIKPETLNGVHVDVVTPADGIPAANKRRILINLHGGGMSIGAGLGGQLESIPIASVGRITVVTVDYREGPEHKFPAASEDVATVYKELLKAYPPKNIGIFGCSAGGWLTAESVAWFLTHSLPGPGAIAMLSSGAIVPMIGDSNYLGAALEGAEAPAYGRYGTEVELPYFNVPGLDLRDPLVSPAYSPSILKTFPPSLLISATRDIGLSAAAFTHSEMTRLGLDAELHVWEGIGHCMFTDPAVPEAREAWSVVAKFFDKHLGFL